MWYLFVVIASDGVLPIFHMWFRLSATRGGALEMSERVPVYPSWPVTNRIFTKIESTASLVLILNI